MSAVEDNDDQHGDQADARSTERGASQAIKQTDIGADEFVDGEPEHRTHDEPDCDEGDAHHQPILVG